MSVSFFNNIKTAVLLGAMIALFVAVGAALGEAYILPAFIIGVLMNVGAFLFSHKMAIKAMRGREVTAETGGDFYRMVERLSERAGLPMPRVYLCPHQAPNAFATGPSPKKAAVAVTQGALDLLAPSELEGVIAHELAHVKNRDTLISTIAATIAGIFAMLAQWMFFFMPFGLVGGGDRGGGGALAGIAVLLIGAVGAALLKAMISRSREFAADADGARIAGTPDGLIAALQKLEAYSKRVPLRQPNPAMNNMFIVEPFTGQSLTKLFASHPPTEERVKALRKAG